MDTVNRAYKKLTNANGLIRVFSIIALVFALIGTLLEPLGKMLYNMFFSNKIDHLLADTFKNNLLVSQYSIICLVMAVVLMIAAFSSKHKKNIGQGFGSMFVLVSFFMSITPFINLLDYTSSNSFKRYMDGADNLKFVALTRLMVFIIPITVAVLFILCGLILVVRASGENPTEVTYVPTKVKSKPQQGFNPQQGFAPQNQFNNMNQGFGQPQGFNNNNNTIGGFGAAPFGTPNGNTQSPFARPQGNAVPTSAPVMDEIKTSAPEPFKPIEEKTEMTVDKTVDNAAEQTASLPKVCSECGTVLAENAKFCKGCGKPV